MQKSVKISLSVLLVVGISVFLMSSTRSEQPDRTSLIHLMAVVPEVPSQVEFAGENISLDRLDMYERYDRELTGFCYNHSTTLLVLKRANRYFSMIVPVLEKNGIPADFVYLAAIESSFNPKALSPVKAAGLWQLMPSTAQQLGLEVNEYVDERYHVEKSTEAACRYLKSAYAEYGDWMAAAASYNAGRGRISTELKKQQAQNVFDLWLNDETSRYVFRLMAMKAVLSDPYRYGFAVKKKQLYQPVRTRMVTVTTPIDDLAQFARDNGITYAQLKEYNLWLRDRSLPNKTGREYQIAIPERDDLYYTSRKMETYQKSWTVD
ncbi:MAG: lytic transglycosylase domain-containing protein [Coprobacter sp.]|nr:lytic transglycosylase domain-containing protein [Coprobacter sp.]